MVLGQSTMDLPSIWQIRGLVCVGVLFQDPLAKPQVPALRSTQQVLRRQLGAGLHLVVGDQGKPRPRLNDSSGVHLVSFMALSAKKLGHRLE